MPRGTTRRRFLTAAGVAGATALAGCGGPGSSGGGSGKGGDLVWLYGESDRGLSQELSQLVNANALNLQTALRKGGNDIQNVKRLNRGEADLVVAGNDIAYFASNGTGIPEFSSSQGKIRGIAALYPRPVTVFSRPGLDADTVRDLSNPTINIGPASSPLALTSSQILSGAQIQFSASQSGMVAGVEQAARGEIDAAVAVGDWPVPAIQEVARNSDLGALSLTDQSRQRTLSSSQWLVETRLPAAVYEGINYPVQTVGNKALLMTRAGLSAGKITRVAEAIFQNLDQVTVRSEYLSTESAEKGMTLTLHDGANQYFNF